MERELKKESGRNWHYSKKVLTRQTPLKSGSRDDILQWIYDINIIPWYVTYLLKRPLNSCDVQDKIQELYLEVCRVPQEKWDDLYEQGVYSISAYVSGLIHRQIVSDSSKVYLKYNRYRERFVTMEDSFWDSYWGSDMKDKEEFGDYKEGSL